MSAKVIVGIGHLKQVGKGTFARFLCSYLRIQCRGVQVRNVGFADVLKENCYKMYAWAGHKDPAYYEEHPSAKSEILIPLGMTVRDLWIKYGMMMREIHKDTWLNCTLDIPTDVLITNDMRFVNEAEEIKRRGGILVEITNDRVIPTLDEADRPLLDYEGWDEHIENNGEFNILYAVAVNFADRLIIPRLVS
jgi:hypothetical protein